MRDPYVLDMRERWNRNSEDEPLWWPRVLWIDPGTVSGVACVWFDPKAVFDDLPIARQILAYSEQFLSGPEIGQTGQVARFIAEARYLGQETGLAVGVESFVPRQLNMSPEFLSPVRIGSAIAYGLSILDEPVKIYKQSPSDALRTFTNDRLRQVRMYTPGPDHVNDAKRHALLWLRKLRGAGREQFEELHGHEEGWWE